MGQAEGAAGGEGGLQRTHGHVQEEEPGSGEKAPDLASSAYHEFTLAVIVSIYSVPLFFFQLRSEVQRLEELKLLNIRSVTDAIRSEMAVLWEKCFFSAEQRRAFSPYFSGGLLFAPQLCPSLSSRA